jgi:hypothetical protein
LENRLVEVFARALATSTTVSPLKDEGENWLSGGDANSLSDVLYGPRLERDVAESHTLGTAMISAACSALGVPAAT